MTLPTVTIPPMTLSQTCGALIIGLLLTGSVVLAAPRSAPKPPASELTDIEHLCMSIGGFMRSVAQARDEGISLLRIIEIVRKADRANKTSPEMRKINETLIREVYKMPGGSAASWQQSTELVCLEVMERHGLHPPPMDNRK